MGEEVKKVEEPKKEEVQAAVPEAEKKEEAAVAEGRETKKEEAAKEPPPPPPQNQEMPPQMQRVEVNMAQNQVMVKGIVDLQDICERLRKMTMRNATVISPPPPPPPANADADAAAALKEELVVVHSQVSEVTTVELLVNMHCEACAQQLQKKILKMRSVQSVDTNSGASKLTVTGTMSADRLVQYIHRRTGKFATPPPPGPEPPKEVEPKKEDGDKKLEEPPAEGTNNIEEQEKPPAKDATEKKADEGEKNEDGNAKPKDDAEKKEGGGDDEKAQPELLAVDGLLPEEMMKRMMYWPYPHKHYYNPQVDEEAMMARRMSIVHPYGMSMMQWAPPPPPPPSPALVAAPPTMYQYYNYGMVERPAPAPRYFSDENPNACVIS